MGECTELSTFVNAQEPNDGGKQNDRTFYKKVALLLHPALVQIKHNRVSTFVGIRYILHKVGMYGVATVRTAWIVEIENIKLRLHFVATLMVQQVVIGYRGEVREFEVVNVLSISFLNLLFYKLIYDGVALAAPRCSKHDARSLR